MAAKRYGTDQHHSRQVRCNVVPTGRTCESGRMGNYGDLQRGKCLLLILVALPVLAAAPQVPEEGKQIERSVVRVVNYSQRPDWYSPWNLSRVREVSGSGFIIEGGRVMTNAHLVSDSRNLSIYLHNDPESYEAEVQFIAHDCDLALLRLKEPGILDNVPALGFGTLPRLGSTVVTFGYPTGGTRVSSTRGIVSRIEPQAYTHSNADAHLTGQTDAAINPGNSGGPVLQRDRVVGVAFQVATDLQSVGYFIPTEVIARFMRDVADGRYDGYPDLGVKNSGMENIAARRKAGMNEAESGVRVDMIYPMSSADGRLRVGDILLEVDGSPLANDGSVADGDGRFGFGMLVDRYQLGETVNLRVLRSGERIEINIPLVSFPWSMNVSNLYDALPRYYVYGGLVFISLNLEMLKTFGEEWMTRAPAALLHEYRIRPFYDLDLTTQDRVVLLRRLNHPVNVSMAWSRNEVLDRVNGRVIKSLDDLVVAIETHDGDYHLFEFASFRRFGVLAREKAEDSNAEILERYGVVKDRNL